MTREEAKHIVDVTYTVPLSVRRAGEDRTYYQDEISEAKNMAIQALSQEPTISRLERRVDDNTVVFRTIDGEEVEYVRKEPCDDTVSIRKDALKYRVGNLVVYNVEWLKKHWQMEMDIVCGVKPCDDAVSRDAVREILSNARLGESKLAYELDKLPSVTQKSGKWINKDFRKEEYVLTGKCSVCGRVRILDKFCSYCGAKMVEPQESEE